MSSNRLDNQFLEETIYAIADGYCSINLTQNVVLGEVHQKVNGKVCAINAQMSLSENAPYDEVIARYAKVLKGEERDKFLKIFQREKLLEQFQKGEKHISYKHWIYIEALETMFVEDYMAMFLDDASGEVMAVIYVIDRTKQHQQNKQRKILKETVEALSEERETIAALAKEEEQQKNYLQETNRRLEEQLHVIGGLSNAYFAVYEVDLYNNSCRAIKNIEYFKEAVQNYQTIDDIVKAFVTLCVMPEDQEKMWEFTDWRKLAEWLNESDSMVEEFHGAILPWEWCRASWIVADRDENGRVCEVLFTVEDISATVAERKRIEKERDQEFLLTELRLKTMTEAIHGGFKIGKNDARFTITMVSKQLSEMLGYESPEEMMEVSGGCMSGIVNHEDTARELPKALADVTAGRMYTMHYRVRCKDGSWKNVEDRGRLIHNSNGEEEYWSFIVDHDEIVKKSEALEVEKQTNAALKQAQQDLKIARDEANAANMAKTNFLFNMSHDIRTPMNALLGYTKLMKNELTDPKLLHYQEKIEESGNLLLSIINNVLDMARIESGKMELDENYSNMGDVLKGVCGVFEMEAKKKGLQLICEDQMVHKHIMCDVTKVQEILVNLVSNAVKYTPAGGTVIVRSQELPCEMTGFVRIKTEVIDTGIGMSEEFLPSLFDSFTRERNTTTGKVPGTGLGMPIVKKLVEFMGGNIEVESKLGKGTKFSFVLQHRIADKVYYEEKESKVPEVSLDEIARGKHILLAEDNDLNAEIAVTILEEMGLVVERVEDGIQCINKLEQEHAGSYDLILMDVQMPNMDGYKATQVIRGFPDKEKANIPIVAMTANAFEEDQKMAISRGMDGHIAKPIDVAKIEKVLLSMLK